MFCVLHWQTRKDTFHQDKKGVSPSYRLCNFSSPNICDSSRNVYFRQNSSQSYLSSSLYKSIMNILKTGKNKQRNIRNKKYKIIMDRNSECPLVNICVQIFWWTYFDSRVTETNLHLDRFYFRSVILLFFSAMRYL